MVLMYLLHKSFPSFFTCEVKCMLLATFVLFVKKYIFNKFSADNMCSLLQQVARLSYPGIYIMYWLEMLFCGIITTVGIPKSGRRDQIGIFPDTCKYTIKHKNS